MKVLHQVLFAGIDWGHTQHRGCIVDANGQVLREEPFEQSVAGLARLTAWFVADGDLSPPQIDVAIA
jgi:hypothetical protein